MKNLGIAILAALVIWLTNFALRVAVFHTLHDTWQAAQVLVASRDFDIQVIGVIVIALLGANLVSGLFGGIIASLISPAQAYRCMATICVIYVAMFLLRQWQLQHEGGESYVVDWTEWLAELPGFITQSIACFFGAYLARRLRSATG
jgi:putative Ca2+/H+ antiporter (TMEM165/GDT1 family)